MELVGHHLSVFPIVIRKAQSALDELGRYLYKDEVAPLRVDSKALSGGFEDFLASRLNELDIKILDDPSVSLRTVVERAVEGRRPFKDKHDRGFKDALIWESVKELLVTTDASVILVTSDGDFASGEDLHPDLAEELEDRNRVRLCKHFDAARAVLDEAYDLTAQLKNETTFVEIEDLESRLRFDWLMDGAKTAIAQDLERDLQSNGYPYQDVLLLSDIEDVGGAVHKLEYAGDGVWRIEGEAEFEALVDYWNWNEHPMYADKDAYMTIRVEFTAYIDYETGESGDTIIDNVRRANVTESDLPD